MSYSYTSVDANATQDTRRSETKTIDVTVYDKDANEFTAKVTFEAKANHGLYPSYDVEVQDVILPEGVQLVYADDDIYQAIQESLNSRINEYVK
jgi:hypothetical protein